MEYFLYTKGTIPKGLGFSHFDMTHILWLLIMAATLLYGCYHYRHLSAEGRSRWKKCMAMLLIAAVFAVMYIPIELWKAHEKHKDEKIPKTA